MDRRGSLRGNYESKFFVSSVRRYLDAYLASLISSATASSYSRINFCLSSSVKHSAICSA